MTAGRCKCKPPERDEIRQLGRRHICAGHRAKVRCTYVQPGQGRTPRAPGRLSHSCRIVHAQTLGGASASNPMTVAAASASLGSPARASSVRIGRLRLHSACINPRDRPREKRRVQCPTQREDAREQLRRDGESPEKERESGAEEEMRSIMPRGCALRMWRSAPRVATSLRSRPISRAALGSS